MPRPIAVPLIRSRMSTPHSGPCRTTRSSSPPATEPGTSSGIASCLATWEPAATCGQPWALTRATGATVSVRSCSIAPTRLDYGLGLTRRRRPAQAFPRPQDLRLRLDLCEAGADIRPAGHPLQRPALSAPLPLLTAAGSFTPRTHGCSKVAGRVPQTGRGWREHPRARR